ncbi:hypothetical protein DL93DRAFT_2228059 [Clavulina sp. PMI_390]|nr:hypothetical protein DL93DRAFT_2228059 [Clavulina sp. PMI_390]
MSRISLPNELWLGIFAHIWSKAGPDGILRALLTITSVNVHWRRLAIADPRLWTEIYVPSPSPKHQIYRTSSAQIERVKAFLERSMTAPLTLWLYRIAFPPSLSTTEIAEAESEWKALFRLLEPHMNRCGNLVIFHLAQNSSPLVPELFHLLQAPTFPILRHFWFVDTRQFADQNAIQRPWNIDYRKSPLRKLYFSDMTGYLPQSLDVAWPNLHTLDLSHVPQSRWPEVCKTLAKLPCLLDLKIQLEIQVRSDASPGPLLYLSQSRVILPRLSTITTNYLPAWMDICTPALSRIEFNSLGVYRPSLESSSEAELLKALAELRTTVREVEFRDSLVQARPMLPILRKLDNVEVLTFHGCHSLHTVISEIVTTRKTTGALPSSENLANVRNDSPSGLSCTPALPPRIEFLPLLRIVSFSGQLTVPESAKFYTLLEDLRSSFPVLDVRWEVTGVRTNLFF